MHNNTESAEFQQPVPVLQEADEARVELREVADCVRTLLGAASEPASLGRLYRMHKEIQRQIVEIEADNKSGDFCI